MSICSLGMYLGMAVVSEQGFGIVEAGTISEARTCEAQNQEEKSAKKEGINLVSVIEWALEVCPVVFFTGQSFILRTVRISGQAMYLFEHMLRNKLYLIEHMLG